MSTLVQTPPGIQKSAEFWVDVEVPYNKVVEKWSDKYRGRMVNRMETNRLQRKVFSIYFTMLGRRDVPQDRVEALDTLYEKREEWVYNLCSQFEFSSGLSDALVKKFAKECEQKIIDYGFEKEYRANIGEEDTSFNKDGLVALCQLSKPSSLKNMLIYHRYSNRSPANLYKREQGDVPDEGEWVELINQLSENKVEDYAVWHQFKIDGERFIAIEQEDRDGVERQVGSNIEEEPANLVILHFDGKYLEIYTDKVSTANSALVGINVDVTGDSYGEDRDEVDSEDVGEFTKDIVDQDKQRDKFEEDKYEYVMTDLWVSRTELPNNPAMKLNSEAGVGRAVKELESKGYNLLSDNKKIDKIKIRFKDTKFSITPSKSSDTTGRKYKELVYNCSANTELREKFENLIEKEFGIKLKYKSLK